IKRGGMERPVADCHLDVDYERTDQALKAAWQRIAALPKQIADDVSDPSIRWYWAREFYWNIPGVMPVEEVAAHLLKCARATFLTYWDNFLDLFDVDDAADCLSR